MHVDPNSPLYDDFRDYQRRLQKRLRELRAEYGLTQMDLAESGVSFRHYMRMEQDPTAIISIWQLYKIAEYYEMSVSDLIEV